MYIDWDWNATRALQFHKDMFLVESEEWFMDWSLTQEQCHRASLDYEERWNEV